MRVCAGVRNAKTFLFFNARKQFLLRKSGATRLAGCLSSALVPMGASPHPPVLRLNTRADLLLQKISALEVDLGAIAASTVSMAKIHRQRCKRFFAVSEALQVH